MKFARKPNKQEKHVASMNGISAFFRYFDKHRTHSPPKSGLSSEEIALKVRQHVINFGAYLRWNDAVLMDHSRSEKEAQLLKSWKLITERIPTLRAELENEFRFLPASIA